ncbi:MAG: hypothetical protein ACI8RZ_003738 [Myxococcota bacterium]|jgi:hypothetical protein
MVQRKKLHGAQQHHRSDPPALDLADSWALLVERSAHDRQHVTFLADGIHRETIDQVLAELSAPEAPNISDPLHEYYRVIAVVEDCKTDWNSVWLKRESWAPFRWLMRLWLAQAGIEFVLDMLTRRFAIHVTQQNRTSAGGDDYTGEIVLSDADLAEMTGHPPGPWVVTATREPFWWALRECLAQLSAADFQAALAAARPLRQRLLADSGAPSPPLAARSARVWLSIAFSRDQTWACEDARWVLDGGWSMADHLLLAALSDPALALALAHKPGGSQAETVAPYAWDIVASLGGSAVPVLSYLIEDRAERRRQTWLRTMQAWEKRSLKGALKLAQKIAAAEGP